MKFCACIDTLYTEYPFAERFSRARADGFESVEFWDYRHHDLDVLREEAENAGIAISGFNGDADYSLVDPTHKEKYLEELAKSIAAAKKIGAECQNPFMVLSFLALPVIPELKLTDQGLVDVNRFKVVSLFEP